MPALSSSGGSGQFCQQGSALVKTGFLGSKDFKPPQQQSLPGFSYSPFPHGVKFLWGDPSGAMLLRTRRWCNTVKMFPMLFYVPSLVFELWGRGALLLLYSPFCWPYPPPNSFSIALWSLHPPLQFGISCIRDFLLDFAEIWDCQLCLFWWDELKHWEYCFLPFDFCCVLLSLRYSVLLILARKNT